MSYRTERELSLADPQIGDEESEALKKVIDSGWITMGEMVSRFEKEFARLHGTRDAVAVSSATAGLHLALKALGVGPGDEVLVPSLTFVATANAALYVGATPVFVDIESIYRPHIDISDAQKKITTRTKAVVVVHYGGWLCPLKQWRKFAMDNGLLLIEDAAHTPGLVGAEGRSDAAVYSFYGNKNMTTAEGGMVLVGDETLASSVRRLRSHGMTSNTLDRHEGHAYSYDVTELGYNYRMDELRACLGLVQLGKLADYNQKREELLRQYRKILSEKIEGVIIPFGEDEPTTGHLCPVVMGTTTNRDRLINWLRESGIHSSIHYPPVHRFSYYQETYGEIAVPKTEAYSARTISLPLHPGLTGNDVSFVTDRLIEGLMIKSTSRC